MCSSTRPFLGVLCNDEQNLSFRHMELFDITGNHWLKSVCGNMTTVGSRHEDNQNSPHETANVSRKTTIVPNCIKPLPKIKIYKERHRPAFSRALPLKNIYTIHHQRPLSGMIELDHSIYVVGGLSGSNRSKTVSVYNKVTDYWYPGPKMENARKGMQLVKVEGAIYAIGGGETENTMEFLDPRAGFWTPLPNISEKRIDFGAAASGFKIYVAGGDRRASCRVFELTANLWRITNSLTKVRSRPALMECDNKIYAFGGFTEDSEWIPNAEVYYPKDEKWYKLDINIPEKKWIGAFSVGRDAYLVGSPPENNYVFSIDMWNTFRRDWVGDSIYCEMPFKYGAPAWAKIQLPVPYYSK